ncbi:MAG: M48 family metallopeptidase [Bacteroidales bacterium]|nr:M48 family metallopeptidase [Bacteroidales bacterium]
MLKTIFRISMILLLAVITACSTVPLTGRKQMNLLPESELIQMGFTSYSEFMKENPPSSDRVNAAMVKEVGSNIVGAVNRYFEMNNLTDRLAGYEWEFNLVDQDVPNAWAMPGGKVVVYKGLLPYTGDRNGLAVVIGHEIGHIVARHGNERMSQELLVQLGGMALSEAMSKQPEQTRNIFLLAYGTGSQLGGLLPYSRQHEKEADRLGLIFMAMGGYDPESAVAFWERMSLVSEGGSPPEFLSTHPSDETRIRGIKSYIPEAKKYMPQEN